MYTGVEYVARQRPKSTPRNHHRDSKSASPGHCLLTHLARHLRRGVESGDEEKATTHSSRRGKSAIPRGSKYPKFEASGSKNPILNGLWDQRP